MGKRFKQALQRRENLGWLINMKKDLTELVIRKIQIKPKWITLHNHECYLKKKNTAGSHKSWQRGGANRTVII